MKLRNKKTGEIRNAVDIDMYTDSVYLKVSDGEFDNETIEYHSLAELNADWEDAPEEPKGSALDLIILTLTNFIENEPDEDKVDLEDCRQMLEKLKAWTRLKDKGFRFCGWEDLQALDADDMSFINRYVVDGENVIGFRMNDYHDCINDLNILFGGEE